MPDKKIGDKIVPHVSTTDWCLFSFDNQILKYLYAEDRFVPQTYVTTGQGGVKEFIKEKILRNAFYKKYIANTFGISHISANEEYIIALYSGLFAHQFGDKYGKAKRIKTFDLLDASAPLFQGIAVHGKSQNFYFGEYICGRNQVIRIIRISADLREVDVVYRFKDNPIHHVHGVFYDCYLDRLWITTGDRNDESAIYYTDDEFETMHRLGGGDQSWRAVSVIPTPTHLVWGSDAGRDAGKDDLNKIYAYSYDAKVRRVEADIGNPAYHAMVDDRCNLFIGVNFEPGRKQNTREESSIWMRNEQGCQMLRNFRYGEGKLQGCSSYGYVYFPKGVAPYGKIPYLVLNSTDRKFNSYLLSYA